MGVAAVVWADVAQVVAALVWQAATPVSSVVVTVVVVVSVVLVVGVAVAVAVGVVVVVVVAAVAKRVDALGSVW